VSEERLLVDRLPIFRIRRGRNGLLYLRTIPTMAACSAWSPRGPISSCLGSPSRRQLLSNAGLVFEIEVSGVDEEERHAASPPTAPRRRRSPRRGRNEALRVRPASRGDGDRLRFNACLRGRLFASRRPMDAGAPARATTPRRKIVSAAREEAAARGVHVGGLSTAGPRRQALNRSRSPSPRMPGRNPQCLHFGQRLGDRLRRGAVGGEAASSPPPRRRLKPRSRRRDRIAQKLAARRTCRGRMRSVSGSRRNRPPSSVWVTR